MPLGSTRSRAISHPHAKTPLDGLLYGLAAFGLWGVAPVYFAATFAAAEGQLGPLELLCHRIVWSVVFLLALLTGLRLWPAFLRCFRQPRLLATLLVTTCLIGCNWYVYIYAVHQKEVMQSSLGYFINPLMNVMLGMLIFRENLRMLQWVAVALATIGVVGMTALLGELPWIALSLAGLFAAYGLLRKIAPVDGVVGLAFETFLLVPAALAYLLWMAEEGSLGNYGTQSDTLILLSGVVTALPLICFGQAARRLRLTTMGFLQFVAPTLQFLCAVYVLGEPFSEGKLACFLWIWAGLAVFVFDSAKAFRAHRATQAERAAIERRGG